MDHGPECNCEDCWWSRDCHEICATCGCIVGQGCPCGTEQIEKNKKDGKPYFEIVSVGWGTEWKIGKAVKK